MGNTGGNILKIPEASPKVKTRGLLQLLLDPQASWQHLLVVTSKNSFLVMVARRQSQADTAQPDARERNPGISTHPEIGDHQVPGVDRGATALFREGGGGVGGEAEG